ncbi:MAG: hypothetical protein ACRC3Y_00160 [Romboutsia sp.]|uniref:hypothetical protein n=1 Tax=Romboutsia sp. TaxID=1965302 RepID=UPI003F39949C
MSRDKRERELYNMREKSFYDKVSALSTAREEGELNKAKIAIRNMLKKGMPKDLIAELLEVDEKLVEEIKNQPI